MRLRGKSYENWIMQVTRMIVAGSSHLEGIVGPRNRGRLSRTRLTTSRPNNRPARKDMVAEAVRTCWKLIDSDHQLYIRPGNATIKEYALADEFEVPDDKVHRRGWAKRPTRWNTYGSKYIREYQDKIEELFNRGAKQSSKKKSPAAMLQILETEYPQRSTYRMRTSCEQRSPSCTSNRKRSP